MPVAFKVNTACPKLSAVDVAISIGLHGFKGSGWVTPIVTPGVPVDVLSAG